MKRFNKYGIVLEKSKVPHAIIIEGGDKEKRDSCAIDMCKFIECEEDYQNSNYSICKKIDNNTLTDIKFITQGNNKSIGVESIRKAIEDTLILPNESNFKIYIIKDAETMTLQAQNAILKTLEEPPKFVKFILLCDSSNKMLDTVKSRSIVYSLDISNNLDSEILEVSKKFILSVIFDSQLLSLAVCDSLIKDRIFFQDSIKCIIEYLQKCITYYYNNELIDKLDEEDKKFYLKIINKVSISKILKIIDEMHEIKIMSKKNANMSLLSTVMHLKLISLLR